MIRPVEIPDVTSDVYILYGDRVGDAQRCGFYIGESYDVFVRFRLHVRTNHLCRLRNLKAVILQTFDGSGRERKHLEGRFVNAALHLKMPLTHRLNCGVFPIKSLKRRAPSETTPFEIALEPELSLLKQAIEHFGYTQKLYPKTVPK